MISQTAGFSGTALVLFAESMGISVSAEILVLGTIVLLFLAWLGSFAMNRDAGEATSSILSGVSGILLGIGAVITATVAEMTSFVGETPGFIAAVAVSAVGWISLENIVSVAPEMFIFVAGSIVLGALIVRES